MKAKNKNKGKLVLAEGVSYSMDCYETRLNNNVLVVGASGAGKTRSIVTPNLLSANGSYVVSDPKGNLYKKYRDYLQKEGYAVKLLDFTHPEKSAHYNPFNYIRCEQDIVKVAHMIVYDAELQNAARKDPFWDQAAQLLLEALIALLWEFAPYDEQNLSTMLHFLDSCEIWEDDEDAENGLDLLVKDLAEENPDSFGVKHYHRFRAANTRALKSIIITLAAKLAAFDTKELQEMLFYDDLDIASIGKQKTALFVVVSDTERSLDNLANLFFSQAMNELCLYADNDCPNNELPVPVQFILDDFATNCRIADFPRMIASIRSRGISVMLMIQAQSQLEEAYRKDGGTIIGNCDTYIYLGGNDLETADAVAKRCDLPLEKILSMPVGQNWIFRRGQMPIQGRNLDLDKYIEEMGLKRREGANERLIQTQAMERHDYPKNRGKGKLVLAEGVSYSMDCYETRLNNNVLVVGASGAGKTRSIVTPNLLSANGSYVVSDPKGNLYKKYRDYLQKEGYAVKLLDFTHPEESAHYNPFNYIRCEQDIVKIAHMLIYAAKFRDLDPFWDQAAQLLVEGIIGFQWQFMPPEERNLSVMLDLLDMCEIEAEEAVTKVNNVLDDKMEELEKLGFSDSFGPKHYKRFRKAASITAKSILITVTAKMAAFDTKELQEMLSYDDLDIASIGKRKTALFVVVSDTDRSMDTLANLFFTQAMNELCYYADNDCPNNELPVPVQFILDDFATNCQIDEFPRMIASIRSRGISVMLMIQAQSQLEAAYKKDGRTIIGNCDTYIYLGGNDLETADAVAKRCNLPLKKILSMPAGQNWIFRRGQAPLQGKNLDLDKYIEQMGLKSE